MGNYYHRRRTVSISLFSCEKFYFGMRHFLWPWDIFFSRETFYLRWGSSFHRETFSFTVIFFFLRKTFYSSWDLFFTVRRFLLVWDFFFPRENFSTKNSSVQSKNVWPPYKKELKGYIFMHSVVSETFLWSRKGRSL